MSSIIAQELIEIWKQLFLGVQQDVWYAVITTADFRCNLQAATNLTEEEYDTFLLSSGIIFKRGDITMFRKAKLDYLQTALKQNITLHISRIQLPGNNKRTFHIAIGQPLSNPSVQAKINPRVLPNRRGNGLNEAQLRLLARLCAERASTNEPELIVDERFPPPPQIEEQREQENETQMDNAGGHGKKDVIETYRARLLQELNIILLHQPARSPETNSLDLGFWMALQNRTEKKSFDMRISKNNVFAAVQEAWNEMLARTITNIYDRILKVLDLIVQDNGGNRLVQNNRGLTQEPLDAENGNLP